MANNYFQFKGFKILQEVCAMKVCTDSCLFGAWVKDYLSNQVINSILDIGTGTGLISLMLVQQFSDAVCHSIEIDKEASEEASKNFANSKWAGLFTVFHQDFKEYNPTVKYDLIISNPPFFKNHLTSSDKKRNAAMHSDDFSLTELFSRSSNIVNDNGYLACLIPYNRTVETLEILKTTGWFAEKVTYVKQTPTHDYFRTMLICRKQTYTKIEDEIIIKDNQQYTAKFSKLLQDYYLFL